MVGNTAPTNTSGPPDGVPVAAGGGDSRPAAAGHSDTAAVTAVTGGSECAMAG